MFLEVFIVSLIEIKISVSEKRILKSKSIEISDNTTLTSWGAIHVSFGNSDFFPSSFCITTEDKVLYIDPVMVEPQRTADYIFITHTHPDHFSLEDIRKISDENTVIVCPKKAAKKLGSYKVLQVKPNDTIELDGVKCEVVPAYSKGFPTHPKMNQNAGYVLTVNRSRIYHAGDTDAVDELYSLKDIDTALVPIDGGNLTMSTQDAADLINSIKPRIAIPMHYEVNKNKAAQFSKMVDRNIKVAVLAE